jgi:hypothetical protein
MRPGRDWAATGPSVRRAAANCPSTAGATPPAVTDVRRLLLVARPVGEADRAEASRFAESASRTLSWKHHSSRAPIPPLLATPISCVPAPRPMRSGRVWSRRTSSPWRARSETMPLSSSATITSQSLKITFAMKERSSATVWSIGRKVGVRNDAENTSASASMSPGVARRRIKVWPASITGSTRRAEACYTMEIRPLVEPEEVRYGLRGEPPEPTLKRGWPLCTA